MGKSPAHSAPLRPLGRSAPDPQSEVLTKDCNPAGSARSGPISGGGGIRTLDGPKRPITVFETASSPCVSPANRNRRAWCAPACAPVRTKRCRFRIESDGGGMPLSAHRVTAVLLSESARARGPQGSTRRASARARFRTGPSRQTYGLHAWLSGSRADPPRSQRMPRTVSISSFPSFRRSAAHTHPRCWTRIKSYPHTCDRICSRASTCPGCRRNSSSSTNSRAVRSTCPLPGSGPGACAGPGSGSPT